MLHPTETADQLYGIVAEFDDSDKLLAAANAAREAGYKKMDAYSPLPIDGLSEALGFRDKKIPALMLCGGLLGCSGGFFMQWFANVHSYPLNVGGKPFNSWPQFIVITFECTILLTALTGVFGMILLNGLPQPYHSIFNTPGFENASTDRYFLCIEKADPKFDRAAAMSLLQGTGALRVSEVER